jgi:hypothetical protein
MQTKTLIYGHTVSHDDSVTHGVYFLAHGIDPREAKAFFDEAMNHGHCVFSSSGYKYKLIHHEGWYELIRI